MFRNHRLLKHSIFSTVVLGSLFLGSLSCGDTQKKIVANDQHSSVAVKDVLPMYAVTDMGMLSGYRECSARGINNKAQVVGVCTNLRTPHRVRSNRNRAFLWQRGKIHDLGTLPNRRESMANRINDYSQIVGSSYNGFFDAGHAVLWQGGKIKDLGTLSKLTYSTATSINDRGQVVGYSTDGRWSRNNEVVSHAFSWQNSRMQALKTLGGPYSYAQAVNLQGQIVGKADLSPRYSGPSGGAAQPGFTHACLWQHKAVYDLGTLPNDVFSQALDINDMGQVVGVSSTGVSGHAFLWHDKRMIDVDNLSGEGGASIATSINNHGYVIGYWHTSGLNAREHAFLWRNGHADDLDTLIPTTSGWVLEEATDINDVGQIVGNGLHQGKKRAFLLTPISARR